MKKFATILLAVMAICSLTACEKDKNVLAKKYFDSNIAAYGIYSQVGVDITMNNLNNFYSSTDPKTVAALKLESGTCSQEEFTTFVRANREAMNKALSGVILDEITKQFTADELDKMAKFYSSYYDAQMQKDMRELTLSGNDPKKADALVSKISAEKKKAYKDYNESQLGNRELTFLQSLGTKLELRKAELSKAPMPAKPACAVTAAPAHAAAAHPATKNTNTN